MAEDISAEVRQFIEQSIESIAQLEALVLFRQDPERRWAADDMAKALYVPHEMAATLLANFLQRGFLLHKILQNSMQKHLLYNLPYMQLFSFRNQ